MTRERKARPVEDEDEAVVESHEIEIVYDNNAYSAAKSIREFSGPDPFTKGVDELRAMRGLSSAEKSRLSRQINKYHRGKDGGKTKSVSEEMINGYGHWEVVPPPYNLDYLGRVYESNATHFAAVNAKVKSTVGLGFEWRESAKTQERLAQLKTNKELDFARRKIARVKMECEDWMDSLNEEYTFQEVLEMAMSDYEVFGNGYIEIGRVMKGPRKGMIGYVGHIPAHTMRVRKNRDGFIQIVANKATFFRNFEDFETGNPIGGDSNPNEIIHIKKYAPRNSYYGLPDIIAAIGAVAGIEFAKRFNLDYFEHKAVPRYLILVKGAKLSPDSEKKLVQFFQTNLKGQNHRSVYIPLPQVINGKEVEFQIVPIEAKVQDASFIKYYQSNRDEILMAHRVPKTKVALSEDVSLAVARDADKMFKEQVIRPLQRVIEKKIKRIFLEKTDIVEFKLRELTLTDEETKSKIHEKYLRWQVTTPNEIREELGLKGRKGGDEVVDTFGEKKAAASQDRAEQRSQARQSRTRDSERGQGPDSGQANGRNAAGEGRSTP